MVEREGERERGRVVEREGERGRGRERDREREARVGGVGGEDGHGPLHPLGTNM